MDKKKQHAFILPYNHHDGQYKIKEKKVASVDNDVEISEFLCTVSRNVKWFSHDGKSYDSSSKN